MRYTIYRGAEIVAEDLYLEGSITEKIMGEETANITFSHTEKITFHIGDKITVFGKDYFLSAEPGIDKKSSREFSYSMVFFSVKYALSDIQMFFYDNDNLLTIPDFSIMGNASTCLDAVLLNANRVDFGWTKGTVDTTEVKNISFSDTNCLEGISKIADEFKLEYWIDSDKSIHFTERKPVSGYSFEYGKAKGLKDINRSVLDGGSLVTRLYVKGAETNLPKNYRGGQKNLRIDVPFLEKNTLIYGVKEHTEKFPDIYPKRVGTVTAVDALDPNKFTDADLDFDLNAYNEYGTTVLLSGVAAKIIFQTGQLAGYTIELIAAGGFNSATKTFYLNPVKDEKDLQIPSELLRPAVGDTYIIVDIMMPQSYVTLAETELKAKAQEYLDENSKERFQYAVESDILYFANQNINIQLGSTVHFVDGDFALDDDIRVTGLTKKIQNKYDVKCDLSEVTVVSSIVKSYYEQKKQATTVINSIKYNAELARRNYLFGREFHDKVFDGEDYFKPENIKPLSIETAMVSLGTRLQQFTLPGINFHIIGNTTLTNTAGKIDHETIDPAAVRTWNIAENSISGISENFNYIYIKCQKIGTNANFVVTEAQIKVEADADFYHFQVGYLSSIIDDYRKIKTTYGFAQLNPAELSIGKVSDPTGNNYINLEQDKITIKANVEFTDDSPAYEQINGQLYIGGENLLQQSGSSLPFYDFIADNSRYFNKELPFTYSVDALNSSAEDAVFVIVGKNQTNDYEVIAQKEISLAGVTERIYISFKTVLNNYKKIFSQLVLISDNSVVETEKPKLEIGNRPTDYNQSQYDTNQKISEIEKKTDFLKTSIYGNVVATGTVLLGNSETGANAGLTGEGNLQDTFLWGGSSFTDRNKAPISMSRDGFMKVRNDAGNVIFEIGRKNGKAVFDIFNEMGVKIAQIGTRGIEFTGYVSEAYTLQPMRKLTSIFGNSEDLQNEISENISEILIISAPAPRIDNDWRYYKAELDNDITAFLYSSGRNFESAGNAQYEGYYTDENKLGTPIDDGVYAFTNFQMVIKGTIDVSTNPPIPYEYGKTYYDGSYSITFQVQQIISGKIVNSKAITINKNI